MAKKPYDVVGRFQEVAKRAKEVGPIVTGPKKKKEEVESMDDLRSSFRKQFPNSAGKKGNVNLPIDTGPSSRKRK